MADDGDGTDGLLQEPAEDEEAEDGDGDAVSDVTNGTEAAVSSRTQAAVNAVDPLNTELGKMDGVM